MERADVLPAESGIHALRWISVRRLGRRHLGRLAKFPQLAGLPNVQRKRYRDCTVFGPSSALFFRAQPSGRPFGRHQNRRA
jgi:hypothetical protein